MPKIKYDKNLTEEELNKIERINEIENEDEKEDAQVKMAWIALFSMVFYPVFLGILSFFGLSSAVTAVSGMASTYFGSIAVILSAFFAKQAYTSATKKKVNGSKHKEYFEPVDEKFK